MKTISKQDVLDAYMKTGLKPKEGFYYTFEDKKIVSACAGGVLFFNENPIVPQKSNEIDQWLSNKLGAKASCSLVRGFDGSEPSNVLHDEVVYNIGIELRKELLNKGLIAAT